MGLMHIRVRNQPQLKAAGRLEEGDCVHVEAPGLSTLSGRRKWLSHVWLPRTNISTKRQQMVSARQWHYSEAVEWLGSYWLLQNNSGLRCREEARLNCMLTQIIAGSSTHQDTSGNQESQLMETHWRCVSGQSGRAHGPRAVKDTRSTHRSTNMELPHHTVVRTTSLNGGNVCVLAYWSDWLNREDLNSACVFNRACSGWCVRANMGKLIFPFFYCEGPTKADVCGTCDKAGGWHMCGWWFFRSCVASV